MGIFKSMGGNIPGGNFLDGNFPGANLPVGSLMGGNFPSGNFLDGSSPDTENRWEFFRINLFFFVLVSRMNTSLKLCACIVCSLFFYLCLVRSSHREAFVQIKPSSWKIPVKVFIVIKVAGCKSLALLKLTLSPMF